MNLTTAIYLRFSPLLFPGIFKIENSVQVAKLWGKRKNRPAMNYDKLSRSIRQYYRKGIIKKTSTSKRLVYQFPGQMRGKQFLYCSVIKPIPLMLIL